MPKKMGVNTKAEDARARKATEEADRKHKEAKAKEDEYWQAAEGPKSKAAKKREEEAEKKAEIAAKKAEARRLAELEEKELEKALKKPDKKANRVGGPTVIPKVTEAELRRRKEEEEREMRRKVEEKEKEVRRVKEEEEYERVVMVENRNRDEEIEARSVEEAIAKLSVVTGAGEEGLLPVDKHPEKRMKAAFKAFEEAELPRLKEEKPGLTHTQYKDMIWKLWKKSPDNPLNRITE